MWKIEFNCDAEGWRDSHEFEGRRFDSLNDAYEAVVNRISSNTHRPISQYRAVCVLDSRSSFWQAPMPFGIQPTQPTIIDLASNTESIMPSTPSTPSSSESATNHANPARLINIGIKRVKPDNRLVLSIDARPLHDLLESIGATYNGEMFNDIPSCSYAVLNGEQLSTTIFLRRVYPVQTNLSAIFSTPPTFEKLTALANSGHVAVQRILAHYQPIDIKVTINKLVKAG